MLKTAKMHLKSCKRLLIGQNYIFAGLISTAFCILLKRVNFYHYLRGLIKIFDINCNGIALLERLLLYKSNKSFSLHGNQ